MDDQDKPRDWGNLRFGHGRRTPRSVSEDDAWTRFNIGVVLFLAVALAYPWYAYWVNTRLLAHDMAEAAGELRQASAQALQQAQVRDAHAAEVGRRRQLERRIAAVRVMGVGGSGARPVVVVDFGDASLDEADETICRQAQAWLQRDVAGTGLRLQRYRGRQPAIDAGVLFCR